MGKRKPNRWMGYVRQALSDQGGWGYIDWVCLILAFCMIMSSVMCYVLTITLIAGQRDVAKNVLDNQLSSNALAIFQGVKQQDGTTVREFTDDFLAELVTTCGLESYTGNRYVSKAESGKVRYVLNTPSVTYAEDYTPKLVLRYVITVPLQFAGLDAVWVDVPIQLTARYSAKFD